MILLSILIAGTVAAFWPVPKKQIKASLSKHGTLRRKY